MNAHCLVKHNGNQLELQSDIVDHLTKRVSQVDYIAVGCVIGAPSSAKTGIVNAIVKHFLHKFGPAGSQNCDGFLQPKNAQSEGQRIDGILVSTPPFIIYDNLGRRVAVILLDLWNNGTMSADVYGKLVDFCFQVSSVKVFSLLGPLRQVSWWNGSFDAVNCSTGLKQEYSQLITTLHQMLQREVAAVAVKTCWMDKAEYFPVIIHRDGSGAAVNLNEGCCNFILTQIFTGSNIDRCWKPADFIDHLIKCVTTVNNSTRRLSQTEPTQPPQNLQAVQPNTRNPARSQQILQAYKQRLIEVYSKSPGLFLSSQELKEYSNGLLNDRGNDKEEIVASCGPFYQKLQQFHAGVQSSLGIMEGQVNKHVGETLSSYEKQFASGFKKDLENYSIHQDIENDQSSLNSAVETITVQALKTLHSSQCHLEDETEILASKLKFSIKQQLVQELEKLEKQVELIINTFKVFKSKLDGKLQCSACISEKEFEEAARHGRNSIEPKHEGGIQPSFIRTRDEAMQEYEDKLRQQNHQIWKSELRLAKQATGVAADFVLNLLTEHLKKFGVLIDNEVLRACRTASKNAKKAFLSVPGFNFSPPWQEAQQSLPSVLEDRFSEVRQINLNAIRRWDRMLESALRSSAEFYSQQMDQRLPKYKISLKELENTHEACADKTVSQFTVSSEVNDPTKVYWKKLLVKNQLQEWKEGYVRVNETKKPLEEVKKSHFPEETQKTNYAQKVSQSAVPQPAPPQTQSFPLPPPSIGLYFGPEIVIISALLPDGTGTQLPIAPFAACSETKIFWGEKALEVARSTGQLINIFSVLTEPTVPLEKPCTMKFNGESVCLTAEALSVLFFKELISEIIVRTGRGIRSCAVTLPGLLPRGAMTAVKEAIRLAGFSKVTLVPFTTAMALPVALPAPKESGESARNAKKIVTIYHAGKFLEAALLMSSPGKLEVKKLVGSLDLFTVSPGDLPSTTRKLVEKVTEKDLSATVIMVGTECNPVMMESLTKAIREMDQQKLWKLPIGTKENGFKSSMNPAEIALTMAEFDDSLLDSSKPQRKFPEFNYLHPHEMKLPHEAILMVSSRNEKIYRYFPKPRDSRFDFIEKSKRIQWNYTFDLNLQSSSGQFCNFVFREDGSFCIAPPSNGPGIPVHSSSCKLFTFWGQDIVKQNVERVVKLMGRKDTEKIASVEVKKQDASEVRKTENSAKFTLSQLVRQVEDGLKNSGLNQGPVYDHINFSLQECRQVLQNVATTEQKLNVATRKLKICSSKLLQS